MDRIDNDISEIDIRQLAPDCREVRTALGSLGLPYATEIRLKSVGYGIERSEYRIRRRQRTGHQIIMTLSGHGWTNIAGQRYELEAGSLWHTASGERQDYGLAGDTWEILWFEICEDSHWWDELVGESKGGIHTHRWGSYIRPLALALYDEQQESHFGSEDTIRSYAHLIVTYLDRDMRQVFSASSRSPHENKLHAMADIVRDQLTADWTLDHLMAASGLHMSQDHFIRLSKVTLGKTPLQIVKEQRLGKAQELLLYSDYKLEQIADMVGYANQFSLSTSFKRQYGVSPEHYRKKNSQE